MGYEARNKYLTELRARRVCWIAIGWIHGKEDSQPNRILKIQAGP